jgi:hypothetical protein
MDGSARRLHAGEDFTGTVENMRRMVHSRAHRSGLRAITRVVAGDPKAVDIMVIRPGGE